MDFPYFSKVLSLLGWEGTDVGYNPNFLAMLNSNSFITLYNEGAKMFVNYNNENNKGNNNYRAVSKSPPYSLLKFYSIFKIDENYINQN